VSAYATTNVREATAEMMRLWWLAPAPTPPIVPLFGELMTIHFGVVR
jgi:hypothetical protein